MLRVFKYFSISLFIFTIIALFLFFNLGNILDVSQKPVKSDIIVCLGGGEKYRIETSVNLYKKGYSKNNILVLTGDERSVKRKEKGLPDKRIEYLEEQDSQYINIIQEKNTKSTKEEVLFIKKLMIEKNYNSAMIVSDGPHTRRIQTLINLTNIKDENLNFNLVASKNNWWNKNTYYTERKANAFVFSEVFKLGYSYIAYGIFEPIGLLEFVEESSIIQYFRKALARQNYLYIKEK